MRKRVFLLVLTIIVGINVSVFGQVLSSGANISVCAGSSVVVTALPQASGANQYSWSGGTDPVVVATAPSPTTTIEVIPVSSPYVLTCYFFNGTTYLASATVIITVNPVPNVTGVESLTQCADGDFTLISSNTPQNLSFQWQMSTDGTTWNNVIGETENMLVVTNLTNQNGKRYRSIATYTSTGCSDTTGVKTLTVNESPSFTITDNTALTICGDLVTTYTVTVTGGSFPYTVNLFGSSHPYIFGGPNNQATVTINTDGGSALFDVILATPPSAGQTVTGFTTSYTVIDSKGCY